LREHLFGAGQSRLADDHPGAVYRDSLSAKALQGERS
jgi:hypothetical protein